MKTAYCFDLDGTVTKNEILPALSNEIGLHEEMEALTKATIQGVIPFSSSFKLRCKLLEDLPVSRAQEIVLNMALHDKIIGFIERKKEDSYILTGNLDIWIKHLMGRINCTFYCSKAEVVNDRLKGITTILNKAQAVKKIKEKYDSIVSIGDGMGDVPMFEESDINIAFGGVHMPVDTVIEMSNYITFNEDGLCNILNTL